MDICYFYLLFSPQHAKLLSLSLPQSRTSSYLLVRAFSNRLPLSHVYGLMVLSEFSSACVVPSSLIFWAADLTSSWW